MSLEESQRQYLVHRELEKAHVTMEETEIMVASERWEGAASRLYYSVFHAICALLISEKHEVKSHKGAGVSFRQYYIYTGIFPRQYGQLYGQLESLREESDYNCFYDVSPDEVLSRIEPAKQMIAAIGQRVSQQ